MGRDEAKEYLKGLGIEEPSKEQIDSLLSNVHKNDNEQQNKIDELTKKIGDLTKQTEKYSDYDTIKKQLDDINKANMSEQEKLEAQKKEIEKNLKESKVTLNKSKVRERLSGLNLDDEQLSNLVESMVSDDESISLSRADLYVNTFNTMKETVAKETKENLLNTNIKPDIKGKVNEIDDGKMTFEKFSAMSVDEQNAFALEHPEELARL